MVTRRRADEQGALRGEPHHRRHDLLALSRQHLHFAVYQRGDLGVRRAQINPYDDVSHGDSLLCLLSLLGP